VYKVIRKLKKTFNFLVKIGYNGKRKVKIKTCKIAEFAVSGWIYINTPTYSITHGAWVRMGGKHWG
jgi:hypothetical protein